MFYLVSLQILIDHNHHYHHHYCYKYLLTANANSLEGNIYRVGEASYFPVLISKTPEGLK